MKANGFKGLEFADKALLDLIGRPSALRAEDGTRGGGLPLEALKHLLHVGQGHVLQGLLLLLSPQRFQRRLNALSLLGHAVSSRRRLVGAL